MYRKRFRLLAAAAACLALALLSTPPLAQAEPPETVEITFGLYVNYDGMYDPDPVPDPYYVGEDTVAILTGELEGISFFFRFVDGSPAVGEFDDYPDGKIEVKGTLWYYHGYATILNIGGPTEALLLVNSMPLPPAHYPLLFDEITEVHTSWITIDSSLRLCVQESCNPGETEAVFIIVKGRFRVKH